MLHSALVRILFLPIRMTILPIWGQVVGGLTSGIAGGLLGGGDSPSTTVKPMYKSISGGWSY